MNTPKSYTKKPVTIKALQWNATAQVWDAMTTFIGDSHVMSPGPIGSKSFYIETLEGRMQVSDGDYVIRGVEGEFYPCKPGIFEKTYDEATP